MEEITLTSAGVEALRRELMQLRTALAAGESRLALAIEHAGNAGEVGEYLDAQREHELLARRVAVLEEWLDRAHVLAAEDRAHASAALGAQAEFEDVDTGERSTFELVSSPESDVAHGRLSVDSPVGRALIGHAVGDSLEVITPKGRRHLRLLAVR